MREDDRWSPALDLFWEEADLDEAEEHPLRRELSHRLDVIARYERMLADAQSQGHEGQISALAKQHQRQLHLIERLQDALRQHDERARTDAGSTDARRPSRPS